MATSTIQKEFKYTHFGDYETLPNTGKYIFPKDGVLMIYCPMYAGAYVTVSLYNPDDSSAGALAVAANATGAPQLAGTLFNAVPVFAGMKGEVNGRIAGNGSYARFRPFE